MLIIEITEFAKVEEAAINMNCTFGYKSYTFNGIDLVEIHTTSKALIAYINVNLVSDRVKQMFYTL